MKTLTYIPIALVLAVSLAAAEEKKSDQTLGEKTSETLQKAKEKTKEVGRAVVDTTKKATNAVIDAVTPDKDARKVEVTLTERRIDLPKSLEAGKTAFVVRNADDAKHNFKIEGEGIDKKFFTDLSPEETKVLHVDLKPGSYKVFCPGDDQKEHGTAELTVR